MEEPRIPQMYILARIIDETEQASVHAALRITPCKCAIVSDYRDLPFATTFCTGRVIYADSDALAVAAKLISENIRPVLVIGSAEVLDAVYDDGMRETLVSKCQTV